MENSIFFETLILSGVATGLVGLCARLKIPSIVGFIFTGMLIGPTGLKLVSKLPNTSLLTEIIGVLLMFSIGLEFSRQKLIQLKSQFLQLGGLQVLLTISATILIGLWWADTSWRTDLLYGLLLAPSSTALVLKILHDKRDMHSPHGQNSLGILLFQDVAVAPMLMLLPILAHNQGGIAAMDLQKLTLWLLKSMGVIALVWILGRYVLPYTLAQVVKKHSDELFFFSILFVALLFSEIFHVGGLSASLGAFIAGLLIAESDFGNHTASVFVPLRNTLLGLFFATIGTLIDLKFMAQNITSMFSLVMLGFGLKAFLIQLICLIFRGSFVTATITAILLSQIGEFSFLLASKASDMGLLKPVEYQYFLAVSVLSMLGTPFLYMLAPFITRVQPKTLWYDIWPRSISKSSRRMLKEKIEGQDLSKDPGTDFGFTLVIGYGVAGQNVTTSLRSLNLPVRVIELNYSIAKAKKNSEIPVIFGDATQPEILNKAGLGQARLVVITVSGSVAIPRILEVIRRERPDIDVIVRLQFLRDAQGIKADNKTQIVIAEIETAMELVTLSLRYYGVGPEEAHRMLSDARRKVTEFTQIGTGGVFNHIHLPGWTLEAQLWPAKIQEGDFACGKTLSELALPRMTGSTVALVYRLGLGATIPNGDLVLQKDDVLHLLASQQFDNRTRDYLKSGLVTGGS